MRTSPIARVFDASGPFLSLYLATSGEVENAGPRVELRWKNVRGDLLEQGVPETLLAAVDPLVEGSHRAGETLAVVASVEGVRWAANLPKRLPREVVVRWSSLPSLLPLLAHEQAQLPYVAVLASRASAELVAAGGGSGQESVTLEGEQAPVLRRSAPGGWSQPRYQHHAEVIWERNAAQVADALAAMVDRVRPRLVAVAGDVRALQFLRDKSPKRVRELLEVVGGELPSIDAVLDETAKRVAALVEQDTRRLLERFNQERGHGDLAADGVGPTVAALARAQVDTLLLAGDDPDDRRVAWFGDSGQRIALDRDALGAEGAGTPAEGRLVDVAVWAALTSGAHVRVLGLGAAGPPVPAERLPRDGLGALLRFAAS